jgi:hypothetical protein
LKLSFLIHAIKIESFFIRQILSSSLVINSLILDENDGKRASNSVSIIDLDNAASKSIDMSNTDIENIRNDAVDVEKLYSEIEKKNDIQEGLKAQQKQLNHFSTDKIYELTSINSKTGIRSNDKPK